MLEKGLELFSTDGRAPGRSHVLVLSTSICLKKYTPRDKGELNNIVPWNSSRYY